VTASSTWSPVRSRRTTRRRPSRWVSCRLQVEVVNETDVILWDKIDPMAAANCIKTVAAGTTTLDTGSAIVINTDGTVTLSATLVGNAKAIKFIARRG
jgi:hypothetical protein